MEAELAVEVEMKSSRTWLSLAVSGVEKEFVLPPLWGTPFTANGQLNFLFDLTADELREFFARFNKASNGCDNEMDNLRFTYVRNSSSVRVTLNADQAYRLFKTCYTPLVAEAVEKKVAEILFLPRR